MRVKKKVCCDCGKVLTKDEIALSQKLIDLDTEDFIVCHAWQNISDAPRMICTLKFENSKNRDAPCFCERTAIVCWRIKSEKFSLTWLY